MLYFIGQEIRKYATTHKAAGNQTNGITTATIIGHPPPGDHCVFLKIRPIIDFVVSCMNHLPAGQKTGFTYFAMKNKPVIEIEQKGRNKMG